MTVGEDRHRAPRPPSARRSRRRRALPRRPRPRRRLSRRATASSPDACRGSPGWSGPRKRHSSILTTARSICASTVHAGQLAGSKRRHRRCSPAPARSPEPRQPPGSVRAASRPFSVSGTSTWTACRPLLLDSVSAWRTSTIGPAPGVLLESHARPLLVPLRRPSSPSGARSRAGWPARGGWARRSMALTASALLAPAASSRQLARGAQHGQAQCLIRCGGGLGESSTPTHTASSPASNASAPGNSEATWPSGPMPSTIRSSTGTSVQRCSKLSASSGTYCAAPSSCWPSSPRTRRTCPAGTAAGSSRVLGGQQVVALLVPRTDERPPSANDSGTALQSSGSPADSSTVRPGRVSAAERQVRHAALGDRAAEVTCHVLGCLCCHCLRRRPRGQPRHVSIARAALSAGT